MPCELSPGPSQTLVGALLKLEAQVHRSGVQGCVWGYHLSGRRIALSPVLGQLFSSSIWDYTLGRSLSPTSNKGGMNSALLLLMHCCGAGTGPFGLCRPKVSEGQIY